MNELIAKLESDNLTGAERIRIMQDMVLAYNYDDVFLCDITKLSMLGVKRKLAGLEDNISDQSWSRIRANYMKLIKNSVRHEYTDEDLVKFKNKYVAEVAKYNPNGKVVKTIAREATTKKKKYHPPLPGLEEWVLTALQRSGNTIMVDKYFSKVPVSRYIDEFCKLGYEVKIEPTTNGHHVVTLIKSSCDKLLVDWKTGYINRSL